MQICSSGSKLLLACLLFLLPSSLAFAGGATVDCSGATPGAFTSLNTAVISSPDHTSFLVSGTCTENVFIQSRTDLNFQGNPTATIQSPTADVETLSINSSQNIRFSNFVFTGGQGIVITTSPSVSLGVITVQSSGGFGITTSDSVVHLNRSSVSGNTRTGIVTNRSTFYLDGADSVNNNGRLGISAGATRLEMADNFGPNIISHNGLAGVQIFDTGQGQFSGDNEITSNAGQFGLLIQSNSGLNMAGGLINSNLGTGLFCDANSECLITGAHIDSNGAGGIQILEHSQVSLGTMDISNNTGTGILVDQGSSLTSGTDTIANNTGDALILNTLSTLKFTATDTITASAGNLALNCNNGSIVDGDISTYKPKKCGAQFQAGPIH